MNERGSFRSFEFSRMRRECEIHLNFGQSGMLFYDWIFFGGD